MTNVVCEQLGITYPILQGPMAWASYSRLVAAVSNAGGLGILGIGSVPLSVARAEVRATKDLTERPFGFNAYAFLPNIAEMCDMLLEE
jgi:enoyl-[acyl-carrier protein] reductase II